MMVLAGCTGGVLGGSDPDSGGARSDGSRPRADSGEVEPGADAGSFGFDGGSSSRDSAIALDARASTGGGGMGVCTEVGWCTYPSTNMTAVCPPDTDYEYTFYCHNVVDAWGGAIADTSRNRLVLWGGGHNDYYGNEVYAFDLDDQTMYRLDDPGAIEPFNDTCPDELSDGTPNSRHTYSGLAYIAHADRMYAFGGSLGCRGGHGGVLTWTYDFATLRWRNMMPSGDRPPADVQLGVDAVYDPESRLVFLANRSSLYSYDYDANRYTELGDLSLGLNGNAVLDPSRRRIYLFTNDEGGSRYWYWIDLAAGAGYAVHTVDGGARGCEAIYYGPGLAYDPMTRTIVAWTNSGNDVTIFDPDTATCTTQSYGGGPVPPDYAGTYGRLQYFAAYDVFALVAWGAGDAYTLRLER